MNRSLLTVVTPAADYSLVDLATVKDELGIVDSLLDIRLQRWIRESKDAIQGYIGRVLRAETVRETIRGAWDYRYDYFPPYYPRHHNFVDTTPGLALRRYPVVSVTAITESGVALDPAADYEVDAQAGILYRLAGDARVNWSSPTLIIDYVGGYQNLTDIPGPIVEANLSLIKHRRAAQTREPGLRALTVPGVSERQWWVPGPNDQTMLPPEVIGLLQRFREVRM